MSSDTSSTSSTLNPSNEFFSNNSDNLTVTNNGFDLQHYEQWDKSIQGIIDVLRSRFNMTLQLPITSIEREEMSAKFIASITELELKRQDIREKKAVLHHIKCIMSCSKNSWSKRKVLDATLDDTLESRLAKLITLTKIERYFKVILDGVDYSKDILAAMIAVLEISDPVGSVSRDVLFAKLVNHLPDLSPEKWNRISHLQFF